MSDSAVFWPAIIAGAVAAAAITLLLFALGSALGLAIVSPWPGMGAGAATFAVSTAIWLVIVQWISSGIGGYMVGRLRTRWTGVHTDEVFFRDTAHGFLAWSIATLVVVGLLASSVAAVVGGTAGAASQAIGAGAGQVAAAGAGQGEEGADPFSTSYFVDLLFRPGPTGAGAAAPGQSATPPAATGPSGGAASTEAAGSQNDSRAEVGRILAQGITGQISEDDRNYLAQVIATRAGIPEEEAQQRINRVVASIEETKVTLQQAADQARRAGAAAAGLGFLSLLVGAFIACVAAVVGGNQRDGLAPWRMRMESA